MRTNSDFVLGSFNIDSIDLTVNETESTSHCGNGCETILNPLFTGLYQVRATNGRETRVVCHQCYELLITQGWQLIALPK